MIIPTKNLCTFVSPFSPLYSQFFPQHFARPTNTLQDFSTYPQPILLLILYLYIKREKNKNTKLKKSFRAKSDSQLCIKSNKNIIQWFNYKWYSSIIRTTRVSVFHQNFSSRPSYCWKAQKKCDRSDTLLWFFEIVVIQKLKENMYLECKSNCLRRLLRVLL